MRNNREEFSILKKKIDMSNLKTLRIKKGYSQVKLQHLVGVSNSSIEAYEQKVRIPSLPIAYRLSEVLGCSIDYLVGKSHELDKYYLLSQSDKDKVINFIETLSTKK
ncbi:MAG: helix-turn-helix transcriptional regulator [Firmicutes bacterium]|nr:helix-turn-helix transcriptional regulator [Bacillota bacterium]